MNSEERAYFLCEQYHKQIDTYRPKIGTHRFPLSFSRFNIRQLPANMPEIVYGDFQCAGTLIKNFINAPRIVTGSFLCHSCQVTTLEGFPEEVHGSILVTGYTAKYIRQYMEDRLYAKLAIQGTNDEAGLGVLLDII